MSPRSSEGMTCCRSLRRRLAGHDLKLIFMMTAHLVKSLSCKDCGDSVLVNPTSWILSFSFEAERDCFSLSRLLWLSDDVASLPWEAGAKTGIGSSRFTKASAV